jgi:hypothetical protein
VVSDEDSRDECMSKLSNQGSPPRAIVAVVSRPEEKTKRGRSISPQAGRALETLGHAIEYLTDELVHEGVSLCHHDPRLEAIQLLMARNREIYLACPVVLSLQERLRGFAQLIFDKIRREHERGLVYFGRAARWIFR